MEVTIRPLEEIDAYTSVIWRNDSEVFKYTGNTYDHIITLDSELNWIRKVINNANDYRCAILADNKYVGNIYLTDIRDGSATYHIFIGDKNYWGKGVAREASVKLLNYGFIELQLDNISLAVKKQNSRALNLYTTLGFIQTSSDETWVHMIIYRDGFLNKINAEKV